MYHHYAKLMNKNDDAHQNLEITEQFIRDYCARTELETKARDAALLLLKQLEECRNPPCDCKEKEPKKEDKKEEIKEEAPKEEVQEEVEEPVISEEKFKKLQNTRQGKKSYIEFLKGQIKTIGLAGVIAMSTAVYTQGQVVHKNGMVVYEVLEKEFPILSTIKNFLIGTVSSGTSQNNSGSGSSSGSSNSSTASTTASEPSNSSPSSKTSTDSSDASIVSTDKSQKSTQAVKQTASVEETTDSGDVLGGDKSPGVNDTDKQFSQPIAPPKTTETNPQ
jgi:hypothetical protein